MNAKVILLAVSNDPQLDSQYVGRGKSLKLAYENLQEQSYAVEDIKPEDVLFYEATPIEVEVQFVKKEVVQRITAVTDGLPKPIKRK